MSNRVGLSEISLVGAKIPHQVGNTIYLDDSGQRTLGKVAYHLYRIEGFHFQCYYQYCNCCYYDGHSVLQNATVIS